jgi:AcrR family transcriptional regulator
VSAVRARLPAAQRREALVDAALCVFVTGSYRAATTAEIARAAGISEPILYRHFASKRDLYLACLDACWARVRELWDAARDEEEDPSAWLPAMGRAYLEATDRRTMLVELWVQALTEAGRDPTIRRALRSHLKEVHAYVTGVIGAAQEAGGVLAERDPVSEGWIWMSFGLVGIISRRLPGLLDEALPGIFASRRLWMTGRPV